MIRKLLGIMARGHTLGVSPLLLDVHTLCGLLHVRIPPADLLHMARLRYLRRLLHTCHAVLWQLLMETKDVDGSWIQACAASFGWFRKFYSDRFEMPPSDEIVDWLPIIRRVASKPRDNLADAIGNPWRKRLLGRNASTILSVLVVEFFRMNQYHASHVGHVSCVRRVLVPRRRWHHTLRACIAIDMWRCCTPWEKSVTDAVAATTIEVG